MTKAVYLIAGLALGAGGTYLAMSVLPSAGEVSPSARLSPHAESGPSALAESRTPAGGAAQVEAPRELADPGQAATELSRLPTLERGIYARGRALYDIFRRIPAGERGTVFKQLAGMSLDVQDRSDLMNGYLQIWVEADAPAAADAFRELAQRDQVTGIDSLAYAWSAIDPEGAYGWAKALPPGQIRSSAIGHSLSIIGRTDMPRALQELATLDPASARWAGAAVYTSWAQRDPRQAAESALNLVQDKPGGEWALFSVGTQWGRQDPKMALAWIEHGLSGNPLGLNMAATIVASASAINPAEVAMLLWDQSASPHGSQLSAVALQNWLEQDPEAARSWFGLVDPEKGAQFVLNASRSGHGLSATTWLQLAETLPPSELRTEAMRNLVGSWSALQPENALNYVSKLKDQALASTLVPQVLTGLAASQPDLALRMALDLGKGNARSEALSSIASVWASRNPTDATSALLSLPTSQDRDYLLANAAATWVNTDPDAAIRWAQSLPAGEASRDLVFRGISGNLARSHPTRALETAMNIRDEGSRRSQVDALVTYWAKQDGQAARAWLEASPLPDADKARLAANLKQ